ncbi:MAG TPA: GNAT family N-acetyltransferase [Pseudonocardiaceae bacterium]|nr:GNAT family N-acetyltransferase [Pseudonocardiaceae bacterium]
MSRPDADPLDAGPDTAGRWHVRPAEPGGPDLDLVVRWMAEPHIEQFWRQGWNADRWAQEITQQRAGDHSLPCLAFYDRTPVAYLEVYRVIRDRLAEYYPYDSADLGVHVAIGERGSTGRGWGRALLRAVTDGIFDVSPPCRRVVAEPDARNWPSLRAFAAAGFVPCGQLVLPEKTAVLMVRPRTERDLPS